MKTKHKKILRTAAIAYSAMALVLLPWVFYLARSLPTQHVAWHWDVSWVGLDIALAIALVTTGLFAYRQSRLIIISGTALGSLLLLDAWFDILSQRGGDSMQQAVLMALLIEIPVAIASFMLAARALAWDVPKPHIAKKRPKK